MAKVHNRTDDWEDRSVQYRKFRYDMRVGAAFDVDQVEYQSTPEGLRAVAVIELTRPDDIVRSPHAYLPTVDKRYLSGNPQHEHLLQVSEALGVDLWVVVSENPISRFFVKNATTKTEWHTLSPQAYTKWIGLGCPRSTKQGN